MVIGDTSKAGERGHRAADALCRELPIGADVRGQTGGVFMLAEDLDPRRVASNMNASQGEVNGVGTEVDGGDGPGALVRRRQDKPGAGARWGHSTRMHRP